MTPKNLSAEDTTISPEDAAKAARTIASFATDAEECRMLLAMCGVTPPAPKEQARRGDGLVSNLKARRHVDRLIAEHGAVRTRIAKAAGLSPNTLRELDNHPWCTPATVKAILAVTPEMCAKPPRVPREGGASVSSAAAVEHLRMLRRTRSAKEIAVDAQVSVDYLRRIIRGDQPIIYATTEARILAVSPMDGAVAS